MSIIFLILLYKLKSDFKNEYKENIWSMVFVFVAEISITVFLFCENTFGHHTDFNLPIVKATFIFIYLGVYPIIQSLGFIFIKKTRDPLDGVSKLDLVVIVSIT